MAEQAISLEELNKEVQGVIQRGFPGSVWVTAEISELRVNRSGHCYLELVEKSEQEERLKAKARGIIWSFTYQMIRPYFETVTGQALTSGIKIMALVNVQFHELYGFSIIVKDIDPQYTLGDMARRKMEILQKLEEEGVIDMNKQIPTPSVFQKLAVISSSNAAGYRDFIDQLENNGYGYVFYHKLFPAVMQGNETEPSIIEALEHIFKYEDFFDGVVIIRGGGAKSDLNAFNNYQLGNHIAQFPLPVLTGIGHERDESVVDLVAHTKLKTPTAAAEYLVSQMHDFEQMLLNYQNRFLEFVDQYITDKKQDINEQTYRLKTAVNTTLINQRHHLGTASDRLQLFVRQYLASEKKQLDDFTKDLQTKTKITLQSNENRLNAYTARCQNGVRHYMTQRKHQLELHENTLKYLDPKNVLKRGFSITLHNNKVVKNVADLQHNTEVETHLYKGKFTSTVNQINKK